MGFENGVWETMKSIIVFETNFFWNDIPSIFAFCLLIKNLLSIWYRWVQPRS